MQDKIKTSQINYAERIAHLAPQGALVRIVDSIAKGEPASPDDVYHMLGSAAEIINLAVDYLCDEENLSDSQAPLGGIDRQRFMSVLCTASDLIKISQLSSMA